MRMQKIAPLFLLFSVACSADETTDVTTIDSAVDAGEPDVGHPDATAADALVQEAGPVDGGFEDAGVDAGLTTGGYVILTNLGLHDSYYPAVERLAAHRSAEVLTFDPAQVQSVKPALEARMPRFVALLLEPIDIDINLARSFLMMSTELDADPFPDFAYGFLTGVTSTAAIAFVDTIIRAENDNVQNDPFTVAGWSASSLNFVYQSTSGYLSYLNPASYAEIYLETGDPQAVSFFTQNAHYLSGNALLDVGHNGDPHMLWLFEGGNTVPDMWDYDPGLVENPPVVRNGLTSDHVRALDLYPAVVFNGACHSGVLKRALVEGDIAATFGETYGVARFYEMSDGFSFALAMLQTGITGYFAPIGSNNANDSGEDLYNAVLYDEPLGEIHKRNMDAVVMAFLGNRPNLVLFTDGGSQTHETLPTGNYDPDDFSWAQSAMLSGKANRIYFGDPAFHPFTNHRADALNLVTNTVTPIDANTQELSLVFDKPDTYFPLWDKFHDGGARIYTSVELPAEFAMGTVTVESASSTYTRVIDAWEQHRGRTILHLEVDIPDPGHGLDPLSLTITLRITR